MSQNILDKNSKIDDISLPREWEWGFLPPHGNGACADLDHTILQFQPNRMVTLHTIAFLDRSNVLGETQLTLRLYGRYPLIHWGDHDTQFSFSGVNLVSTTIFMPYFDALKISLLYDFVDNQADECPVMDILRSRVSSSNHRQNLELCFIPVPNLRESYAGRVRCVTQIYWEEGNFVSLVANLALHGQILCTSEPKWKLNSLAVEAIKTLRKSVKQLTMDIFAKGNRSCRLTGSLVQLRVTNLNHNRNHEEIFTRFDGYQFLTCYVEPYISLYFFLAPFQPELWACLAISVVTIVTVMTIVYHSRSEKEPFSVWLFILATLFEETGYLPRKMEKTTFCRLSLGIWCLMSVILTNGYNGIMILELNAPRKVFHPDNFDQLRCLNQFDDTVKMINKYGWINPNEVEKTEADPHIIIGYQAYWRFYDEIQKIWTQTPDRIVDLNTTNVRYKCYQLLSAFNANTGYDNLPEFLSLLLKLAFELLDLRDENPQKNISQKMHRDLNLFNSKHSFYPRGFSYLTGSINYSVQEGKIENEVVQCGKTVFVGKSTELKIEYEFLSRKYPKTKFFTSSEAIQTYPSGVVFKTPWKSLALIRFKIVLEAGIWGHEDLGRRGTKAEKP
ncbi:Glutamate receptor ionotropic, delta-2 [Folsomia candida]|uniref:Glutamate receptor ionotropic, delta-2 n=1 Tax=Folsomia candida TaxID=158441 RepID=A0A226DLZ7_FOLCA|nr:Glutamate receptor ionotropic, delta-2 [Folsomia candida]